MHCICAVAITSKPQCGETALVAALMIREHSNGGLGEHAAPTLVQGRDADRQRPAIESIPASSSFEVLRDSTDLPPDAAISP